VRTLSNKCADMLEGGDALVPLYQSTFLSLVETLAKNGSTELGGTIELRRSMTPTIGMTRPRGVAGRVPTRSVPVMKRSSRYNNTTISSKRWPGNGNPASSARPGDVFAALACREGSQARQPSAITERSRERLSHSGGLRNTAAHCPVSPHGVNWMDASEAELPKGIDDQRICRNDRVSVARHSAQ